MNPFDFPTQVEDREIAARARSRLARERGVRLPTFAELADPARCARGGRAQRSPRSTRTSPHPLNLYRVHWFNAIDRTGQVAHAGPRRAAEALTGVQARIVVALGALFPMIRAHKVLAAYACLAPRLVSGRFDPTRQRAVWPSTGNYCRGGVAISRILGLPRRRRAAGRHERGALRVARALGARARGHRAHAGHGVATSRRSTTRCAELARDPANEIVNQFSEFGNYLGHWRCTGPALGGVFEALARSRRGLRAGRLRLGQRLGGHARRRRLPQGRSTARGSPWSRRSNARRCSTTATASTTSRASATSTCR